jgi:hypothetical protein
VQLAEAKAQAAIAESRDAVAIEASKQAEDRHSQQLKDFYLVTRAKRRTLTLEERECPILDGIPIASMEKIQVAIVDVPPAPLPTDASQVISETGSLDGEEILPLTQPPPRDGACSHAILPKDSSSSEACF